MLVDASAPLIFKQFYWVRQCLDWKQDVHCKKPGFIQKKKGKRNERRRKKKVFIIKPAIRDWWWRLVYSCGNLEQSAALFFKTRRQNHVALLKNVAKELPAQAKHCHRSVVTHLPWKLAPPLPVLQIRYWQHFSVKKEMSGEYLLCSFVQKA